MNNKTECSICDWELEEDEVAMSGYFGILPVAFCDTCYSCMLDMAEQILGLDEQHEEH